MRLPSQTKKRLTLLLAIIVAISFGIAGLYHYQQKKRYRQAQEHRQQGMAAYEAGNYQQAVEHLEQYLRQESEDAQALYRYAHAQLQVPEPGNYHVARAISALQRVLQIDSQYPQAADELLELYRLTDNSSEALALAQRILQTNPQHRDALRTQAMELARQGQSAQALEAAQACLELDELDWGMRLLSFQLRSQAGEPAQQLVQEAQALREAHPEDPRFEMIQAYTYVLLGDGDQAQQWLATAATRPSPGPDFSITLVQLLDRAQMFETSLKVLQQAVQQQQAAPDDAQKARLRKELVRRLLEAGQPDEAVTLLKDLDPADPETDTDLLGLLAMALMEADQEPQAVINALDQQENPRASAWATVLRAAATQDASRPVRLIQACRSALATISSEAFFHALLGEAYAAVGEHELALEQWKQAAQQRPSWSAPQLAQALLLTETTQFDQAVEAARAALVRQPQSVAAAVAWATARAARLEHNPQVADDSAEQILALIDQIQQAAPGEGRSLLLGIRLLTRTQGDQAAIQAIQTALDPQAPPLSEGTLLALAARSQSLQPELGKACLERAKALHGLTPNLALAQGLRLAQQGHVEQGLKLVESSRPKTPADGGLEWRVAIAQFFDATDDPRALEAWQSLLNDHPQNVALHQAALRAGSVRQDRALTDSLITGLRQALGDQAVGWRIERARWLLEGSPSQDQASQAASLMQEVISLAPTRLEARLLFAQAQEKLGLLPLAIRELRAAAQLQPQAGPIDLELARLHQALRHYRSAREHLDRVIQAPAADPALLQQAARMLAQQGEAQAALAVLEKLPNHGRTGRWEDDLLLARLYQHTGQDDQVQALCQDLLEHPSPVAVAYAADLLASQGQMEQAQAAIDRLQNLDAPADQKHLARALFLAKFGQPDEAVAAYRAAARAQPQNASLWRQLAAYQLMIGRFDDALATAQEALSAVPDDPSMQMLKTYAPRLKALAQKHESLRPLMAVLVEDREHRAAAAEVIQALEETDRQGQPMTQAIAALRPLAVRNPNFLALQQLLARLYLEAGQPQEALAVATQAMDLFPTAVEPAWIAAEAAAAAGQWPSTLLAATEWRRRSMNRSLSADLMIAEAKLRLGEARSAIETIQPYLDEAMKDPDQYASVIVGYARSLIASGQTTRAQELLAPLLGRSSDWRLAWIRLAMLAMPDPATAKAWLERVSPYVADDAVDEQVTLAQSWWLLADRFQRPDFRQPARQIVERIIQQPNASAQAWHMRALMAEHQQDAATAQASYRKALELNPDLHVARNNLAMLLAQDDQSLDEALQLAQQVVAAVPNSPPFLDTLAYIQARAHQCDAAIQNMQQAIQLDPQNPVWRENLAKILAMCGQQERESELLQTIHAATQPSE